MFKILRTVGKKRIGRITTLHGHIDTPAFMPDATYATVPYLTVEDLKQIGIKEIVSTTLHLEQKLGSLYLNKLGGLHKFMRWERPILTDSGGWQVFSLIHRNRNRNNVVTDAGCSFIDYTTGKYHFLSPEVSQLIHHLVVLHIRIALDEPIEVENSLKIIKHSVERNINWAKRSKEMFLRLNNLEAADLVNTKHNNLRPLLTAV